MRAVIVGSSIAGMASAIGLAKTGVDVIVLEADDSAPPDNVGAELEWERPGVPQHPQAHAFLGLFVKTMQELAPKVIQEVVSRGAIWRSTEDLTPSTIADRRDELTGDISDLVVINARRPFVEAIMRHQVLSLPNIEVRAGVSIQTIGATSRQHVPHTTGVVTSRGETIDADVVIDATGRRTRIDDWLEDLGGPPAAFSMESCNQVYFSRYYRLLRDDDLPALNSGFLTVTPFPWGSVLMFPGDNGILQVAMGCLPEDTAIKRVRNNEAFHRMAELAPAVAPWVDPQLSEPINDVRPMGNLNNHLRRLVREGEPVVTGIHLVGDSAAITNPQYGRGVSHAVGHAATVVQAITQHPDDFRKQALRVDAEVEQHLLPSFQSSVRADRTRTAMWRKSLGIQQPVAAEDLVIPSLSADPMKAFAVSSIEPVVWRAVTRSAFLLDPSGSWANDPDILERISNAELPDDPAEQEALPTRQQVVDAIS